MTRTIPAPRSGDIGKEIKRINVEPLEEPGTAPVEEPAAPVEEPVAPVLVPA